MKAAIITRPGVTPALSELPKPEAATGLVRINVIASAISQVTRGRASGSHYSATNSFPFVPGMDGVGRSENGERVYFVFPQAPHGGMAEQTLVRPENLIPLPAAIDDVTAAAIANPGMSSVAALTERALLKPGETVLINGATGASGRLAVQLARHLGASRVIATGRSSHALEEIEALGADRTIDLSQGPEALAADIRAVFDEGIDIVLDYLWGPSAEMLLVAAARAGKPLRYVEIGSIAGGNITLPGAVLRSSAITMMGSGIGSVPPARLFAAIGGVFGAFEPAGLKIATKAYPLEAIETAWSAGDSRARTVITIG